MGLIDGVNIITEIVNEVLTRDKAEAELGNRENDILIGYMPSGGGGGGQPGDSSNVVSFLEHKKRKESYLGVQAA